MAGRGRGMGGAGRGRGRGNMSFNMEQLGLSPGEGLPGPVLQPPPLYPPMEFCPAQLEKNEFYEKQRVIKSDFVNHFNKSNFFMYSNQYEIKGDQFNDEITEEIEKPLSLDWTYFPTELRPSAKRKRNVSKLKPPLKIVKKNIGNLNTLLEELEKKETTEDNLENEAEVTEKKKDDDEQEEQDEDVEEDDLDEEMDDGTDYNQNYFDNGDDYLDDEDDNLDDGPIY
uniref:DNA-directed RNA polymerase III subunit n=1 Tax=Clastoptera arizonana TaxID=38151 RepID=A0A1B6C034_9HEMI